MNRWLLFAIAALYCLPVGAAQFFVDFLAGSDANNGTSTGTAFKHAPGDPTATGTAASTTLAPGDTVVFKGGVSYRLTPPSGNITLNWSGTAADPIIYDGSGATWGTGYAVITDTNSPNSASAAFFTSVLRSNLVFSSFNISNIGGAPSLPLDLGEPVAPNSGSGILLLGGVRNLVVSNCNFYGLGYWFSEPPMDDNSINGAGIVVADSYDGIVVTNSTFNRMAQGVSLTAATTGSNVFIRGNTFSYIVRWSIPIASSASNVRRDGHYVQNNVFTNLGPISGDWTGYGGGPHVDGIISYGSGSYLGELVGTNFLHISGNTFSANRKINNGTAPIFLASAPWALVYNNLFWFTAMGNGCISIVDGSSDATTPNRIGIYNNTFVDEQSILLYALTENGWPIAHNVRIRNNIFADFNPATGTRLFSIGNGLGDTNAIYGAPYEFFKTNWLHSHNLYYHTNSSTPLSWIGDIQYGALINNNWGVGLQTNNPLFVAASLITGLRLTSLSPAVNAGTNLFSFFATDKDGTARPAAGDWDIGAYRFIEAASVGNVSVGGNFTISGRWTGQ